MKVGHLGTIQVMSIEIFIGPTLGVRFEALEST